jgi:hypothetical protein
MLGPAPFSKRWVRTVLQSHGALADAPCCICCLHAAMVVQSELARWSCRIAGTLPLQGPAPRRAQRSRMQTQTQSMFGGGKKSAGPAYICKDCGVGSRKPMFTAYPASAPQCYWEWLPWWRGCLSTVLVCQLPHAQHVQWQPCCNCSTSRRVLRASPRATGARCVKRPRSGSLSTRYLIP